MEGCGSLFICAGGALEFEEKLSVGGDVRVCVGFTQLYGRQ